MSENDTDFLNRHCVEYPAGTPTLDAGTVDRYIALVPGWEVQDEGKELHHIERFDDFMGAIGFVNKLAELAEEEQHHPDIYVYSYRWLAIDLSTHSIGGLSDNDFIMAVKINRLLKTVADQPPST